jgi:hypothetical protein
VRSAGIFTAHTGLPPAAKKNRGLCWGRRPPPIGNPTVPCASLGGTAVGAAAVHDAQNGFRSRPAAEIFLLGVASGLAYKSILRNDLKMHTGDKAA